MIPNAVIPNAVIPSAEGPSAEGPTVEPQSHDGRRWLRAAAALLAVGVIWLVALPWLGEQEPIREHVDALHAADINASAMFYSELECGYMLRH